MQTLSSLAGYLILPLAIILALTVVAWIVVTWMRSKGRVVRLPARKPRTPSRS